MHTSGAAPSPRLTRASVTLAIVTSSLVAAADPPAPPVPPPDAGQRPAGQTLVTTAPSPPANRPPPSAPPEIWYGWKTLTIAGASLSTGNAGWVLLPVSDDLGGPMLFFGWGPALGGCLLGGPIVHWAYGRLERGLGVLVMNILF